jgi:fructose-specific phosphotransferase system IIC component
MGSMLASSVIDRGFIGGVIGSALTSSVVDLGFIGGVMGSMLSTSVVDRGLCYPLHHRYTHDLPH